MGKQVEFFSRIRLLAATPNTGMILAGRSMPSAMNDVR
jgi:hypothetical protein